MFLPFYTSDLRNSSREDERIDGPVGKPKEVRVNSESLPKQGSNQPGKAVEPHRSCIFAGGRSATNRSFAGLILNNTPPALGNRNSLRLNLVSRKTHFCSRQSKGDSFVTETRMRQPQSVFATQLPSEMSQNAHLRVPSRRYLHSPAKYGTAFSHVRPRLPMLSAMLEVC